MVKKKSSLPIWSYQSDYIQRRLNKVRAVSRHVLTVFNHECVVYHDFANQDYCIKIKVLYWLKDAGKRKWSYLLGSGDWMLQLNNVPTLSLCLVQDFFGKISSSLICYSGSLILLAFYKIFKFPLIGRNSRSQIILGGMRQVLFWKVEEMLG